MVPFKIVKWACDGSGASIGKDSFTGKDVWRSMEWLLQDFSRANGLTCYPDSKGFAALRKIPIPFVAALHVGERVFHPECFQLCGDNMVQDGKERLAWDGLSGIWPDGAQCAGCRIKTLPVSLDLRELTTIIYSVYKIAWNYPRFLTEIPNHDTVLTENDALALYYRLRRMGENFQSLNESASRADKER